MNLVEFSYKDKAYHVNPEHIVAIEKKLDDEIEVVAMHTSIGLVFFTCEDIDVVVSKLEHNYA